MIVFSTFLIPEIHWRETSRHRLESRTLSTTKKFLDEASEYIRNLKTSDGQSILTSRRKTGFLGFLVDIDAVVGLVQDLVNVENPVLKYRLTYKMSQDHLELFFSAVRASGGWNNNPTSRQFTNGLQAAAHETQTSKEDVEIAVLKMTQRFLNSVQDQCEINSLPTGISDVALARRYDLALREPVTNDQRLLRCFQCHRTIRFQRGSDLIHCWVCDQDGGKEDPLHAVHRRIDDN